MAKIDEGILGGFRGKVGPVIGYRWKDRWCVRARPVHVHNPRTAAQTAHRMLFREMVQLAAALRPGLRIGLRAMAMREGMTEMNAFCRLNWQESGRRPYEALRVSEGPVAKVGVALARLEGDVLRVEFGRGVARGADGVRLLVYNAARRESLLTAVAPRSGGTLAVALPTGWVADELHIYAFAHDAAGRCSPSEYVKVGEETANEQEREDSNATVDTGSEVLPADGFNYSLISEMTQSKKARVGPRTMSRSSFV